MRQVSYILTLLIILLLTSCLSDLNFEEPQPSGDRNEIKFKNKFRGVYLCLDDSSTLTISKGKVFQEWHIVGKLTRAEIDTTEGVELRGDLLYSEDSKEPFSVIFNGDTAVVKYDFTRAIFEVSDKQVLRYFKGVYFLNYKTSDDIWTVKTMKLDKNGVLTVKRIYGGAKEIQKIKEVTLVEEIKDEAGKIVDYKIRPSKKELKEIMKSDLFREGNRFQKIKN